MTETLPLKPNIIPCNGQLFCEEITVEEKYGNIVIPSETSAPKKGVIISKCADHPNQPDKYEIGQTIIFSANAQKLNIKVDDKFYFFINKSQILAIWDGRES